MKSLILLAGLFVSGCAVVPAPGYNYGGPIVQPNIYPDPVIVSPQIYAPNPNPVIISNNYISPRRPYNYWNNGYYNRPGHGGYRPGPPRYYDRPGHGGYRPPPVYGRPGHGGYRPPVHGRPGHGNMPPPIHGRPMPGNRPPPIHGRPVPRPLTINPGFRQY